MQDPAICPYYGCDEDACDVGCGYITSHDANMIIKYCSSKYHACQKYRQLAETYDAQPLGSLRPKQPYYPAPTATPVPSLGLLGMGLTTALFSLDQLPQISMNIHLLGIALLLGALTQIIAGLSALKTNALRAVAFTGYGLFWLSMLALDVLPRAGYGDIPGALPMVGYMAMWGLFSLILCQGIENLSKLCRLAFMQLTAFLMLMAVYHASSSIAALHTAALMGITSCLPGLYIAARQLRHEIDRAMHPELARAGE